MLQFHCILSLEEAHSALRSSIHLSASTTYPGIHGLFGIDKLKDSSAYEAFYERPLVATKNGERASGDLTLQLEVCDREHFGSQARRGSPTNQ